MIMIQYTNIQLYKISLSTMITSQVVSGAGSSGGGCVSKWFVWPVAQVSGLMLCNPFTRISILQYACA